MGKLHDLARAVLRKKGDEEAVADPRELVLRLPILDDEWRKVAGSLLGAIAILEETERRARKGGAEDIADTTKGLIRKLDGILDRALP